MFKLDSLQFFAMKDRLKSISFEEDLDSGNDAKEEKSQPTQISDNDENFLFSHLFIGRETCNSRGSPKQKCNS